jgi:soluble lytic murein transglycosylase
MFRMFGRYATFTLAAAGVALLGLRAAPTDPGAELKSGIDAVNAKKFAAAVPLLNGLGKKLPQLADYSAFYLAIAQSALQNYAAVPPAAEIVFAQTPKSPLRGRAVLMAADAYLNLSQPQDAIRILREHSSEIPAPQGDMLLADALLAAGDKTNAAVSYQRVYYGYPTSPASPRALAALQQLKLDLGEDYPPALPTAMLGRAVKLLDAGQGANARKEFEALLPQLGGAERDLARVGVGSAMYTSGQFAAAHEYLSGLKVASDEADAERLHYMAQASRRLQKLDEMDTMALQNAKLHPKSAWTVDALVAAGNRHLSENEVAKFEPLYQACYEGAPADPDSALCHWKVTWQHYMRRESDAAQMLRDQLRMYPAADQASASLYFLGRLAQNEGDIPSARSFYNEAATEYPNQFYATISRERLAKLPKTEPSESAAEFLRSVSFPQRSRTQDFTVTPAAKARVQRGSLLVKAGFKDLAESELRFGADQGDQPVVLAMELFRLVNPSDPAQAMKYIKRYARGYLLTPIPSAPTEFWQMAFPLPYRTPLERYTMEHSVDIYLMAGLIRQESEFDPQAVSVAKARGLTQIEPSTGRDLARRLKLTYSLAKLFQPEFNLQLGTYYFSWLTKQLNGNTEAALASYNAGMSRAKTWLTWNEYKEPAEFIETVPITQTHDYIQAVLRNAATYREIYAMPPKPARTAAE